MAMRASIYQLLMLAVWLSRVAVLAYAVDGANIGEI